jgi:hypothetical protein
MKLQERENANFRDFADLEQTAALSHSLTSKHESDRGGRKSKRRLINLQTVAEVLQAEGLDPTREIIGVLPFLEPELKARVLLELLQYTQPKLKAVEMNITADVTQYVAEIPAVVSNAEWQRLHAVN